MTTFENPIEHATAAASGASATERFHTDKSPFEAVKDTPAERVDLLAREILDAVHATIRKHQVTYDEYNALKAWLIQVGQDGEWPLFLDVWVEHVVEDVATAHRHGNKGTIEGPYYVPNAPDSAPSERCRCATARKAARWCGRAPSPLPTESRWRARSNSGTPTPTASTLSSRRASRSGICAGHSRLAPTASSRSPRFDRRRTRFPRTARAAN